MTGLCFTLYVPAAGQRETTKWRSSVVKVGAVVKGSERKKGMEWKVSSEAIAMFINHTAMQKINAVLYAGTLSD